MGKLKENMQLAIEDLEINLELSHLIEKELEFTTARFEKEISSNQLNINEYQHKLNFITALHSQQLSELHLRLDVLKEIVENNN